MMRIKHCLSTMRNISRWFGVKFPADLKLDKLMTRLSRQIGIA